MKPSKSCRLDLGRVYPHTGVALYRAGVHICSALANSGQACWRLWRDFATPSDTATGQAAQTQETCNTNLRVIWHCRAARAPRNLPSHQKVV